MTFGRHLHPVAFAFGLVVTLIAVLGWVRPVQAEIRIDITQGVIQPLPIAITPFAGGGSDAKFGQDIAGVITANLTRSGLFRAIPPNAFIQDPASLQQGPRFGDWKVTGAEGLVTGLIQSQGDGRIRVEFRLWDVVAEQQLTGLAYFTEPGNWRRIAHIISDAIYRRLTGEDGYFDTRIVFVAENGPATARVKRLAIMDQDGENLRYLTDGANLVLTPRFSPTVQEITYLAYANNRPRVYLFNIDSGRQEVLGEFPGMSFAPRFSPDGNRVVFSVAQDGNTDIFAMDLRTRSVAQLTREPGIDTAPSFSPDGSQIVFESDRGGSQQIYIMNADGSGVRRLSFGQGRYGTPVWSPRGDLIAFTRQGGGRFTIGVIRPDGTGERDLVNAYSVEGPTWAPNGRVLMYFTGGTTGSRLVAVDVTGQYSWNVPTPTDASDPAWSPILP